MLSRKPITRSQRGFRLKYPSLKLGRMVNCESLLEGDFAPLLEFSPGVVSYREQPVRIEYWDGERMREYFPDFEVQLIDGGLIHVEVKLSTKMARPEVAEKYRAIAKHYQGTDKLFRIVTEQVIRMEPLHSNLRKLSPLRRDLGVELPGALELRNRLGRYPLRLAEIEDRLGKAMTWKLMALGLLICDLTSHLRPDVLLTISRGGKDASLLF